MLHKYKKTALIEAEQFTADPKQVFKYNIFPDDNGTDFDYFGDYFFQLKKEI